jgi:hypothetical protein
MHTINTVIFGDNEITYKYFKQLQDLAKVNNESDKLSISVETDSGFYLLNIHVIRNWLNYGCDETDNYEEVNCICLIDDVNLTASPETKILFEQCDCALLTTKAEFVKLDDDNVERWAGSFCRSNMYQVIYERNSNNKQFFYIYDNSYDHTIPELYKHCEKTEDDEWDVVINMNNHVNILKPLVRLISFRTSSYNKKFD